MQITSNMAQEICISLNVLDSHFLFCDTHKWQIHNYKYNKNKKVYNIYVKI